MEIGAIVRYGGVMPGREAACVDLFTETLKLYSEKLADGRSPPSNPSRSGPVTSKRSWVFVLKGPEEKVTGFFNSIEQRTLQAKGEQIVNHLRIEFLYTGSEVLEQVQHGQAGRTDDACAGRLISRAHMQWPAGAFLSAILRCERPKRLDRRLASHA